MVEYIMLKEFRDGDEVVHRFGSMGALQRFLDSETDSPDDYEIYEVARELEFSRVTITVKEKEVVNE